MKTVAITLTLAFLSPLVRAQQQTPAPPPPPATSPTTHPALWQKLLDIDRRASAISDLTADFEQRKSTPLLKKPLTSTGSIRVRGQAMVWDTRAPEPTVMRIDEREIRLYYPRQAILEIFPIDQRLGSLAASPLPKLDVLKQYFTFAEIPPAGTWSDVTQPHLLALELRPVSDALARHLDRVRVLLDAERGLILRAEMVDADGDRTRIDFSNIKANAGLGEADVRLDVPASVRVSRPLDNLGGAAAPSTGGDPNRQGKRQ